MLARGGRNALGMQPTDVREGFVRVCGAAAPGPRNPRNAPPPGGRSSERLPAGVQSLSADGEIGRYITIEAYLTAQVARIDPESASGSRRPADRLSFVPPNRPPPAASRSYFATLAASNRPQLLRQRWPLDRSSRSCSSRPSNRLLRRELQTVKRPKSTSMPTSIPGRLSHTPGVHIAIGVAAR